MSYTIIDDRGQIGNFKRGLVMDYRVGDWVLYKKTKHSSKPGPRAESVNPSSGGDSYSYVVEKHWIVQEVQEDGKLVLVTRRGKTHLISPDDPSIRKANWWQRFRYRARFSDVLEGQ